MHPIKRKESNVRVRITRALHSQKKKSFNTFDTFCVRNSVGDQRHVGDVDESTE